MLKSILLFFAIISLSSFQVVDEPDYSSCEYQADRQLKEIREILDLPLLDNEVEDLWNYLVGECLNCGCGGATATLSPN